MPCRTLNVAALVAAVGWAVIEFEEVRRQREMVVLWEMRRMGVTVLVQVPDWQKIVR
jgi:hypothetical protein